MANERRSGLRFLDRLILFTAWVVTCGLVYLLGFYVGKGAQVERLGLEERIVRLPVTSAPPQEGQRPKSDAELTFYDKLAAGQGERHAEEPAALPKGPAPAAHAEGSAAPGKAAATAAREAPPAAPAKTAATPPRADGRAAAAPTPSAGRTRTTTTLARTASPRPAVPVAPPAIPTAVAPPPMAAQGPPPTLPPPARFETSAAGGWTVLANPTRSRGEAEALERQLRGRGYDAAVVQVLRDGDTWYRLRVGRYPNADQATAAMHRLREHEGVEHAFVASE